MGQPSPLFTIIIAVYNGSLTLQRCLDSIRQQTFSSWEVVVADGGSTDGTVAIVEKNSDIITYWASEPDDGIYDAWNKALQHANGDWVLFLGADDYLYSPEVLSEACGGLEKAYPSHNIAYGKVLHMDNSGVAIRSFGEPWEAVKSRMKDRMAIPHQATFHHRSLLEGPTPFDTSFRICGDYDFLLREVFRREPVYLDIVVSCMAWGGVSTNSAHAWLHLRELVRLRRKNGLTPLSPLIMRQIIGEAFYSVLSRLLSRRMSSALRRSYNRLLNRPT